MPQGLRQVVEGPLLACVEQSYEAFAGRDGQTVAGGVRRWVWIGAGFDNDPIRARVADAQAFATARGLAVGTAVKAECDLFGSAKGIEHRALTIKPVAGNK